MKSIIALSTILFSLSSFAVTDSLVVTLKARDLSPKNGWKMINLTSVNPKLKKAGLGQFPETVTLTKNDGKVWMKYVALVEKANKLLKMELEIVPDDYMTWESTICYLGKPEGVLSTLKGLTNTLINDDMGIYGYRIGEKVKYTYKGEFLDHAERRQEQEENNAGEVKLWDNYDTTSDTVLLATNYGPQGDGTELNIQIINRCK